jgi:hypothetical protein
MTDMNVAWQAFVGSMGLVMIGIAWVSGVTLCTAGLFSQCARLVVRDTQRNSAPRKRIGERREKEEGNREK